MDNEYENPEEQLQTAKYFFEHDYQDRGMVKWNGYYLSDHTEDLAKYSQKREQVRNQKAMTTMEPEKIAEILMHAYANHLKVQVQQKGHTESGMVPEIIVGMVLGYDDEWTYIGNIALKTMDIGWTDYV
ncbi:MAG: hypothetical protein LBT37_08005 [Lactobacillaceae bacterium]|jgi:uncharacterized cupredoxin-like copper-binding protein|nr:hypothetical protein [Lactobacillaceae bacterium]